MDKSSELLEVVLLENQDGPSMVRGGISGARALALDHHHCLW